MRSVFFWLSVRDHGIPHAVARISRPVTSSREHRDHSLAYGLSKDWRALRARPTPSFLLEVGALRTHGQSICHELVAEIGKDRPQRLIKNSINQRSSWLIALVVNGLLLTTPAFATSDTLPSCKAFESASANIPRNIGQYDWPLKLKVPGIRLPNWVSIDPHQYESVIYAIDEGRNPLFDHGATPAPMPARESTRQERISSGLRDGSIRTALATFNLSGKNTRATVLRVSFPLTFPPSSNDNISNYAIISSQNDQKYKNMPIDPSNSQLLEGFQIVLFGDIALWVGDTEGNIYEVDGSGVIVSKRICVATLRRK